MSSFSKPAPTGELTYLEFRCSTVSYPGKLEVNEQARTVFVGPLTPVGIKAAVEAIEIELMQLLPKETS